MSKQSPHEEEVMHRDGDKMRSKYTDGEGGRASPPNPKEETITTVAADDDNNDSNDTALSVPPLPNEKVPPLPQEDDGWDPIWDPNAQAYYFYNRFTQASQWTNPRVPEAQPTAPGVGNYDRIASAAPGTTPPPSSNEPSVHGGYNPAIHGDYDPTASYAQIPEANSASAPDLPSASTGPEIYTATGVFNRFTGKWQPHDINPENHNDENKSKRQMSAFFDVDAAANSHDGKSLKAERAGKKLSKAEVKAYKEKRKERKEERRRAWLRD